MSTINAVSFKFPHEQVIYAVEKERAEKVSERITHLVEFTISISLTQKTPPNNAPGLNSHFAYEEQKFSESFNPAIGSFYNDPTLSRTIADQLKSLYVQKFSRIEPALLNPDSLISLQVTLCYLDEDWDALTPIELSLPITRQLFTVQAKL